MTALSQNSRNDNSRNNDFISQPPAAKPVAMLPPKKIAPEILEVLLQHQRWHEQRILRFDTDNGPIVVKGQRPARSLAPYRFLNLLARLLKTPFLKAAPAWGGDSAQAIEVRRLCTFKSLGLPVPSILHIDKDFFVMESLGNEDLASAIRTHPQQAYDYWRRGGNLLLKVHQQGQYLSQAFARNFVIQQDKLGLIDFEDDPLDVMTLPDAQVRDWLAYLHSTAWLLPEHQKEMLTQLEMWLRQESSGVYLQMQAAAKRLAWMRHLPSDRKRWGRDLASMHWAGGLLHAWSEIQYENNVVTA